MPIQSMIAFHHDDQKYHTNTCHQGDLSLTLSSHFRSIDKIHTLINMGAIQCISPSRGAAIPHKNAGKSGNHSPEIYNSLQELIMATQRAGATYLHLYQDSGWISFNVNYIDAC